MITSLLKGGYLPRPGVAFAAAETISTSTRCTFIGNSNNDHQIQNQDTSSEKFIEHAVQKITITQKDCTTFSSAQKLPHHKEENYKTMKR